MGIQTASGTFCCQTFGCFDNGDAFYPEVRPGFAITNVHAQAAPGDAERFRFSIEDRTVDLFNLTGNPDFNYANPIFEGIYAVQILNGRQKVNGVISGFGSRGGAWRLDRTVQPLSALVPLPAPVLLLASECLVLVVRRSPRSAASSALPPVQSEPHPVS